MPRVKKESTSSNPWAAEKYNVKIRLLQPMLGTVPSAPIWASHIAKKQGEAMRKDGKDEATIEQELRDTVDDYKSIDALEVGHTTFFKDSKGYYVRDYFIRGFLRETANSLKVWGAMKQLKSKFTKYVFVKPLKTYIAAPEAKLEVVTRPIRCSTPQGERIAIARSDSVPEGTELEFRLETLLGVIPEECLRTVLEYGQYCGLGQWRNSSAGSFELVSFDKL